MPGREPALEPASQVGAAAAAESARPCEPEASSRPPVPSTPALRISPVPAPPSPPVLDPSGSAGIDRRTDDRLRRGRLDIEARIDLHGMTQTQAHSALSSFIKAGWHGHRRTVLVITGKGSGPAGRGAGVLRSAVPRWLNEPPLRQMVVAIRPAQPRHGGEGALYVLLKRRRDLP